MQMHSAMRSARVDALFAETTTLSRYLAVEVALAQTQAELGMIPERAAVSIANAATVERIDRAKFRAAFEEVGFPIVGLVQQLVEVTPEGDGQYVHWGATTQDIMDTELVLALRDAVSWTDQHLASVIATAATLADDHRRTLMIGRSQLQHAVPLTFGFKVAGFVAALERHRTRLAELRPRLLQVQFGGAVGTLASLGSAGLEVRKALARRLNLGEPIICWHTHRDTLCEWMAFLGLVTTTLAKLATDVVLLAQTDVGEVSEAAEGARGTSSTMPHKRNPITSQRIIVAARMVRAHMTTMFEAAVQDHERGSATWQTEWTVVPEATSYALGALAHVDELVRGLEVHPERMREHVGATKGLAYSEAAMMALAPRVGRLRVHDLVAAAVAESRNGETLLACLERSPEVRGVVSPEELRRVFNGDLHVDSAEHAVRTVLANHRSLLRDSERTYDEGSPGRDCR